MIEIIPAKHTKFHHTVYGVGALCVLLLSDPMTFDELFIALKNNKQSKKFIYPSFDACDLTRVLLFLFSIGAISLNKDSRIELCES